MEPVEPWLNGPPQEWIEQGIRQLEALVAIYAAFEDYLQDRDV
jgi:hypothetical protein